MDTRVNVSNLEHASGHPVVYGAPGGEPSGKAGPGPDEAPAPGKPAAEPPPPAPRPWGQPPPWQEEKDLVEEASEESFPASDAPVFNPTKVG